MRTDLWRRFQGLGPSTTTLVATVAAHNPDGTSTLTTLDGGTLRAIGVEVGVGLKAYVQTGRVTGEAADLPTVDLTV